MLDFYGSLLLPAAIIIVLGTVVSALRISLTAKAALLAVLGLWTGLQVSLAAYGSFGLELALDYPLIGIMVAVPLLTVTVAAATLEPVRRALLGLPIELLVALNILRVFGAFFLLLAASGRMAGPFPVSAGWGDVITGVVAIPLAMAIARGLTPTQTLWAWNAFGMLDLVAAVVLGTLSFNGYYFQLISAGPGSDPVQNLPWSLIPTVLVPFYLIVHGVIFAQLRMQQRAMQQIA